MSEPRRESNLTRSQMLIWTGQQLHPGVPLYNMAFVYWLPGRIDPAVFHRAFDTLVAHSDTLRTVIDAADGLPQQRVLPRLECGHIDLDFSDQADPRKAAEDWAQARCMRPFVFDQCLFDSALIRLSVNEYAWFFNQHHVVCDAWSVSVVFNRQSAIYAALRDEQPGPPSEAFPPFEDYMAYECEARSRNGSLPHWAAMREQAPAPAPLFGRVAGRVATTSVRQPLALGVDMSGRLRALAQSPGIRALSTDLALFNLFATLLFAFLYRVSGQRELAIAAPAHNRPTPAFKKTLGLFIEVYPLQVTLDPNDSFRDLHAKVAEQTSSFLRYAMPGAANAANNAGCNTVLNFIRASFADFAGISVEPTWLHSGHKDREHHLRLQVHDFGDDGRFTLHFDFNTEVFDEPRRGRATRYMMQLLEAMLSDMQQVIAVVDLLDDSERRYQLQTLNDTATAEQAHDDVLRCFERQVMRDPAAVAVRCASQAVSYETLNAQAEALAEQLCRLQDDPQGIIALACGRSTEAVVAMLGIMKAGGAYLPLDPNWPADRLVTLLDDAGVATVVLPAGSALELPARFQTVSLDLRDQIAARAASDRVGSTHGEDIAYVMYTSGSTGKPKGVMIPRAALANYIGWAVRHYTDGERLSFPLFTPLTFDLTVTSIFVPLASGGTIQVYPQVDTQADLALLQVMDDDKVDIIKLTPSHLAMIAARDLRRTRVRQLILGGEDLSVDLARRIHEASGGGIRIHNEYGPTEGTVGCIVHTYDPVRDTDGSVPIGRPIENMRAYVLDDAGRLLPEGVIGELCIGGRGLATGYLNRDTLTRERFVADPFASGERLYRTSDQVRLGSQGELEYLGRNDHQVKVRGARIELGEIESVIAAHPGVGRCVVAAMDLHPSVPAGEDVVHCSRCGLASTYPGVDYDAEGVCNQCRGFEAYQSRADSYFRDMDALRAIFAKTQGSDPASYDCIALLSGGKDSTYMLCRLVDLGLNVLAFTLDNGFISDQAKVNIRRVADTLGVDHMFGSTLAMNEIFVDSLQRHANVCQGCFKTIYTLSVNLARDRGIPFIVTGLSRGQFFETRLTEEVFTTPGFDISQIDEVILNARKAYHRVDDAVSRLLDVDVFRDESIFEQVRFIDFYRYCPVDLDEMLRYLDHRVSWVRPSDTGRSTNCLINDAGIHVHKLLRGYHNYALPYSWDVRMGHKTREAALAELDDDIDVADVESILREVGFDTTRHQAVSDKRLVAYVQAEADLDAGVLRDWVKQSLPDFMMPSHFVSMDEFPLSGNGKVDRAALPVPGSERPTLGADFVEPRLPGETVLAKIWCDVLRIERIGIDDNFFELGGDSIMAIQVVAQARRAGLRMLPSQLVDTPTIRELATAVGVVGDDSDGMGSGDMPLLPMAHWLFEQTPSVAGCWNHVLHLRLRNPVRPKVLRQGLAWLVDRHDALRASYRYEADQWHAHVAARAESDRVLLTESRNGDAEGMEATLHRQIDISQGHLLAAGLLSHPGAEDELTIIVHHLAVDAVSWVVLLDELAVACKAFEQGGSPDLPSPAVSLRRWATVLKQAADSTPIRAQLPYWRAVLNRSGKPNDSLPLPRIGDGRAGLSRQLTVEVTASLLHQVPKAGRVSVAEALAASLVWALGPLAHLLYLEGHGRGSVGESMDVSATLGWFTSIYPVNIEAPGERDVSTWLRDLKEQLRDVPQGGVGYGVLRYLSADPAIRESLQATTVGTLFNYLGEIERLVPAGGTFAMVRPLTLVCHPQAVQRYRFEVNAMVVDGRLNVDWSYDANRDSHAEVERLAETHLEHLASLITLCQCGETAPATASDFPLADLGDKDMDKLAALLGGDAQGKS